MPDHTRQGYCCHADTHSEEEDLRDRIPQLEPLYLKRGPGKSTPPPCDRICGQLCGQERQEARIRFERIVDSHGVRAWQPIYFIRSHYFLGQAEEQLGNREAAMAAYQRFLDYWGDGDFEPDRVAHASRFVSSS